MTESLREALPGVLEWLIRVSERQLPPDDARSELAGLRRQHPELGLELLCAEEPFDGSLQYDLILRRAGAGTVSLGYCSEQALPWPLRGAHRWSDADLVKVNRQLLKVAQAIACLDFLWNEVRLVERLIDVCLIQEALEAEPVELSDADLQQAMNAFRQARGLQRAADTRRWLERNGLSHERLERLVTGEALAARLRERVAGERVEAVFEARHAEYDTVRIARIDLPDEGAAQRLAGRIRRGASDFHAEAERLFREEGRPAAFQSLQRRLAPAGWSETVFAADAGALVGPLPAGRRFTVVRVVAHVPARLDDATRRRIEEELFAEWLAERRRAATIEWSWGNARQTASQSLGSPP
jgi:putative peptide maturation system protein